MPSTDITLCASNICPRKRDCAEWFGNNFHLPDDREYSHHDPYKPELGGCEHFRETKGATK